MSPTDGCELDCRRKGRKVRFGMVAGALCVLTACIAARHYWGAGPATAGPPVRSSRAPVRVTKAPGPPRSSSAKAPAAAGRKATEQRIMATINGEEITRTDLAQECLKHYGEAVLERVINKYLILQECKRRNISVAESEVTAEIERIATTYTLPVDRLLDLLEKERGISPQQYSSDIIWPTLALRKLTGQRLQVSEEELKQQFDAQYGPAVKARLIVCGDRSTAERVRAEAASNPDGFGELAKRESIDIASASAKGLIQPIRRHVGHQEIEDVAFGMKEGQISSVIQVGDQYAILRCEGHLPGGRVTFEQVKMSMIDTIRDGKMRQVGGEIRRELQAVANVENVFNDPAKRRAMPGVAAVINGQRITDQELAELCIERHGKEVLEGTINRRLLEQACKKRNIQVTEEDVDEEIRRAASLHVEPKADGSPDIPQWLELVTEEQGVSVQMYRSDAVWPSVALKKLVDGQIEVTAEDLQRGYEANYGARVRCLAIVLNNLRRAQQVWEMARNDPTPENFGELAEQYSGEASSRGLRGQVPPIQKHGGQPVLEKAAFALAKGELSDIVQVGRERWVILLCEGRTEPVKVDFAEVRQEVHQDILDKKRRLAMADHFQKLQESATIDNYLEGTSRSPRGARTARRPSTTR